MIKSTKKEEVLAFIEELLAKAPVSLERIRLVLDNHSSHRSRLLKDFFAAKNVQVLFLPPYSSPLNSVERVWAYFKHEWAKYD